MIAPTIPAELIGVTQKQEIVRCGHDRYLSDARLGATVTVLHFKRVDTGEELNIEFPDHGPNGYSVRLVPNDLTRLQDAILAGNELLERDAQTSLDRREDSQERAKQI